MNVTISPTQSDVLKALGDFLTSVLPPECEVIQGQDNRVPEPSSDNFVTMTPSYRSRLATNVDSYTDTLGTGSIAGNVLTVTALAFGSFKIGATVFAPGILPDTEIVAILTGTGGIGTYQLSTSQTLASGPVAAGVLDMLESARLDVSLQFHGPLGGDFSAIASAALRDGFAVDAIQALNGAVTPLHADEGKQLPFTDESQQVENRWVVECQLEVEQTVEVPQQFAGAVAVGLIDVDARYPAT